MNVLFVLPRMVMGGVERVTLNLIRQFKHDGIKCALALRRSHGELLEEAMQLTAVHEVASRGIHQFVPHLAKLIRTLQPTHIVVVFADICLLTLWARRWAGSKAAVIYGVHNTHGIETSRPGAWGRMRYVIDDCTASIVYRLVDAIVTDSRGVESEVRTLFRVQGDRVLTIHNPVIRAEDLRKIANFPARLASETTRIVAIGRFARQKGFDVLIAAMAKVGKQWKWHLDIYGDGPDRVALSAQIEDSHLLDRITLKGYTTDPLQCLCSGDIFILPSRHEGLPTVLIQALACGIQVVATDCQHGPREILCDGDLGVLVPTEDSAKLAEGIDSVLTGQFHIDPVKLRNRALDFTVENSTKEWHLLLQHFAAAS
jgi:glycosyltransferase involved in cell wall biosynthesis